VGRIRHGGLLSPQWAYHLVALVAAISIKVQSLPTSARI